MTPLILISNDDGPSAKGLQALYQTALLFGHVIVITPTNNSSGQSHSITASRPLRVNTLTQTDQLSIYSCDGTPADCVKLATEHLCPTAPDLVLSGINHGSNSAINVLYSGTIGAVLEASALGLPAIGFSLLSHDPDADFQPSLPFVHHIIQQTLEQGLPEDTALNVNIPKLPDGQIQGIRLCHQAKAEWRNSFEKRIDPRGHPYWWLTGKFICSDSSQGSDEWALSHGYISVVPIHTDFTHYSALQALQHLVL